MIFVSQIKGYLHWMNLEVLDKMKNAVKVEENENKQNS